MNIHRILKPVSTAAASVLVFSSMLFADAEVDGMFDDNQNDFEYYWYYYDDNYRAGPNDRPQSESPGTPSRIGTAYIERNRQYNGDAADTVKVRNYPFKTDNYNDNRFATIPFIFGSTWKASNGEGQPYVGISTQLAASGKSIDLTGATVVKFRIRSRVGTLNVRFEVQTHEIDSISNVPIDSFKGDEFGYYGKTVTATTDWTTCTVNFTDLKLPDSSARNIPFDIQKCTNLTWEIQKDINPSTTVDTFDLDDIVIIDYCKPYSIVSQATPNLTKQRKFATFDIEPYSETPLGTYWFVYSDTSCWNGTSKIISGADCDTVSKYYNIKFIEGSGSDGVGRGIKFSYEIGKPFTLNSIESEGFVGTGCYLYDSIGSNYWDRSLPFGPYGSSSANSIYFEYFTYGDADTIRFQLKDRNDVNDALEPHKNIRGENNVWHVDLPKTNGCWRYAWIKFNSLTSSLNPSDPKFIPFDTAHLAAIEWKVIGSEGQTGTFGLDNVYFLTPTTSVKLPIRPVKNSSFTAIYRNGNLRLRFPDNTSIVTGEADIFNVQGKVIPKIPFEKTNTTLSINFIKEFPSGINFVKIRAIDRQGRMIILQSQLNIIK